MQSFSFLEAVQKLSSFNIKQEQVYLIDLVLLCEMAWADGSVQDGERELLFVYLNHHVDSINRLAGCTVLKYGDARQFLTRFLDTRAEASLVTAIQEIIPAVRLASKDKEEAEKSRMNILNACLDIAASSVTQYPYGLTERFTVEEKEYYHTLAELLTGNGGDA